MILTEQKRYDAQGKGHYIKKAERPIQSQLVLVFGNRLRLEEESLYPQLREEHPDAEIVFCSTAGEIYDDRAGEREVITTAIQFEKTRVETYAVDIQKSQHSFKSGFRLASIIPKDQLRAVLIFSEGMQINGTDMVAGIHELFPAHVLVTGGLAGDGDRFEKTIIGLNGPPVSGKIVAVAFYGSDLKVNYGSRGGWESFGETHLITASDSNVLYELDGQPALKVYKEYLGAHAADLPGSGLLFPFHLYQKYAPPLVRTILQVDEVKGSLTFAGNMPKGSQIRIMRAEIHDLVKGAGNAAQQSTAGQQPPAELALLISCVGRRLLMKERSSEEVREVKNALGAQAAICGFYSYGEICPAGKFLKCELHNQTMTITTFSEV